MKVLIIEDEQPLAEAISQLLSKEKYTVDIATEGDSGLDNALVNEYDVILLDLMLPNLSGFEVLRSLRENKIVTPVLILSAKEDISDKVKGLDLGADDYLTKPFSSDELLARIRSLYRRKSQPIFDNSLPFFDIVLSLSNYELICDKNSVKLGLKELAVLEMLIQNKDLVVSKDTLIDKIWGYNSNAEYNNVEVYISFLRKKLLHIGSKVEIKTLRGVGYCLGVHND